MTVCELWLAGRQLTVTGVGYAPEGQLLEHGQPVALPVDAEVHQLLVAAGLCNDARVLPPNALASQWTMLGDPTEAALRVVARKGGIDEATAFERLGPRFTGPTVLGAGLDRDVLLQDGIERVDGLAAVTGSDDTNVVLARLARQVFRVPRTLARVHTPKHAWMFTPALGLDVALNQANVLAHLIAAEISLGDILYMTVGQLGDAVALLACSITCNFEQGSPIGLALHQQTLGALILTKSKANAYPAQGRSNTLPHSPWAIRSIAWSNSPSEKRCVMMGEGSSRPDCKKRAALYQVAKIWRPVMP